MGWGTWPVQTHVPLRVGGPVPANLFFYRSLSLQSYYQNLLADHQAGVGTGGLSFALSTAFLENWKGFSGLCRGGLGRS